MRAYSIGKNDVNYVINKEKRVIVAYIDCLEGMFEHFLLAHNAPMPSKKINLQMPHRMTGKAYCSEEDEWNEEIGKTIAFDRLKNKIGDSFFKRANLYYDTLSEEVEKIADELDSYGESLSHCSEHRKDKINDWLGEH